LSQLVSELFSSCFSVKKPFQKKSWQNIIKRENYLADFQIRSGRFEIFYLATLLSHSLTLTTGHSNITVMEVKLEGERATATALSSPHSATS
jgi:hypothetical protein